MAKKKKNRVCLSYETRPQVNKTYQDVCREKIVAFAVKHNITVEAVEQIVLEYITKYPDEQNSAGFRNASFRFLEKCLLEKTLNPIAENILTDKTVSAQDFVTEKSVIKTDLQLTKFYRFCEFYQISNYDMENAISNYLAKFPFKSETQGYKHFSDRFLRACVRNSHDLAKEVIAKGFTL